MSGPQFIILLGVIGVIGFALAWWWSGRTKARGLQETAETNRARGEALRHHHNTNAPDNWHS